MGTRTPLTLLSRVEVENSLLSWPCSAWLGNEPGGEQRGFDFSAPSVLGEQARGGEPQCVRVHVPADEPAAECPRLDRAGAAADAWVDHELAAVGERFD